MWKHATIFVQQFSSEHFSTSGKSYEIEIGAQSIYKISLNRIISTSIGYNMDHNIDRNFELAENIRYPNGGRIPNGDIKSTLESNCIIPSSTFHTPFGIHDSLESSSRASQYSFHRRDRRDDTMTKTLDPR